MFTGQRVVRNNKEGTVTRFNGREISITFDDGTEREWGLFTAMEYGLGFLDGDIDQQAQQLKELNEQGRYNSEEYDETARQEQTQMILQTLESDLGTYFVGRTPLEYTEVENQHNIRIRYSGRGINKSNDGSLVLISSIGRSNGSFTYSDSFNENGNYLYSGEGQEGDQRITGGNLLLTESESNHTNIHLYIAVPVNNSKQYFYQGLYKCVGHDEVTEPDKNGNERIVYKFILRKQEL